MCSRSTRTHLSVVAVPQSRRDLTCLCYFCAYDSGCGATRRVSDGRAWGSNRLVVTHGTQQLHSAPTRNGAVRCSCEKVRMIDGRARRNANGLLIERKNRNRCLLIVRRPTATMQTIPLGFCTHLYPNQEQPTAIRTLRPMPIPNSGSKRSKPEAPQAY
jgi:hypothetical protein